VGGWALGLPPPCQPCQIHVESSEHPALYPSATTSRTQKRKCMLLSRAAQSSGLPSIAAAAGEARPQSGNSTMAGQAAQHQKQDQPSPPATPTLPKPIAGQLPCAASTTSSASASSLSSGSGGVATGTGARLRLVAAAAMIPHVDKVRELGERERHSGQREICCRKMDN
jgi:hypothetical protein